MSDPVAAASAAPPRPPGDPPARRTDEGGPPDSFAALLGAAAPPADPSHARSADAGGTQANGDSEGHEAKTDKTDGKHAPDGTATKDPLTQSGPPAAPGPGAPPVGTAVVSPALPLPTAGPAGHPVGTADPAPGRTVAPPAPAVGPVGTAAPAPARPVAPPAPAGPPQPGTLAAARGGTSEPAPAQPAGGSDAQAAASASAPAPAAAPARPVAAPVDPAQVVTTQAATAPPAPAASGSGDRNTGGRDSGDRHDTGVDQPQTAVRALVATAQGGSPAGQVTASAPAPGIQQPAPTDQTQAQPVRSYATLATLTDTTAATMRLAVRSGRPVAEITLHPAELGSVRVTMEAHDDGGVTATVIAQSQDAAQALAQAGRDLRQALAAQGVIVHGLEVQVAADDSRGQSGGRQDNRPATTGRSPAALDPDDRETTIQPAQVLLASGAVDVLA